MMNPSGIAFSKKSLPNSSFQSKKTPFNGFAFNQIRGGQRRFFRMGFFYRKSVNFGPFRVNFSGSGVGYSVGGKGFRVGQT